MKLIAAIGLSLTLGWGCVFAGPETANPAPLCLQYGVIVGHGDTVSIYNVPTTGTGGQTYDIECNLALNADGTLRVSETKVTPTPAVPPGVDQFLPGAYYCVSGQKASITVSGPALAPGGRHVWTYTVENPAGIYGYILGGSWTTGPAVEHPQLVGIPPGSIFPKGYSFGQSGQGNDVIAAQQIGDHLVIGALRKTPHDNAPTTYSLDQGFYVFVRKPATAADTGGAGQ